MVTREALCRLLADVTCPFVRVSRCIEEMKTHFSGRRVRLLLPRQHDGRLPSEPRADWERSDLASEVLRTGREAAAGGLRAIPVRYGGSIRGSVVWQGEDAFPEELGPLLKVVAVELDAVAHPAGDPEAPEVVGRSPSMGSLLGELRLIAQREVPVLIYGERGTGKELIARLIHRWGPRSDRPLVAESAALIPVSLVESHLMGHAVGAFTGATANRRGVFEQARQGTLFLDEVARAEAGLQRGLLRILSARTITPIGADRSTAVDARLITASNIDLEDLVARGEFLGDLLDRLSEERIVVPPLRERPGDLELLIQRFLGAFAPTEVAGDVMEFLRRQPWPGNVRELRVFCAQILTRGDGNLTLESSAAALTRMRRRLVIPTQTRGSEARTLREAVRETELQIIRESVSMHGGRMGEAARSLGVANRTLRSKLSRFRHG
ncbi:MAG: sigma-54-dependent Fis family transcriptional regulator [Candidatus Brocadiae bacterium]|nr:sigma-54-dependent Fis family transcriptional regulator [Candidatus Brocadiia bacterium]